MTPRQIDLVQTSFRDVATIKEQAAALFYNKLFELDPSLKPLFKGDIKEQGKKLMATIGVAVAGLRDLERIVPVVQKLGIKHAGYGVKKAHYDTVAEALLWTLAQGLGPKFTPEVKEAWTETYGLVAKVMQDAAQEAPIQNEIKALLAQALGRLDEFK
ncbi:MAG: globin family protein [Alphaproteobacteria bacterium]|nr:globin family protein [Alphaproteobacteria bacterium]